MSEATAQESVNDAACKMFPRVFLISDRIARLDPRRIRVALIERRRTGRACFCNRVSFSAGCFVQSRIERLFVETHNRVDSGRTPVAGAFRAGMARPSTRYDLPLTER